MSDIESKKCDHCKQNLPLSDFWKCKGRPDGLQLRCKICHTGLLKERRERLIREGKIIPKVLPTKSQWDEAKRLYLEEKISLSEISRKIKVSDTGLANKLRKEGFEIRDYSNYVRKSKFKNRDYFDNIDTADKAYFLGLIYADGCNHRRTRTDKGGIAYCFIISLQEPDGYILKLLNDFLMKDEHSLKLIVKEGRRQKQWALRINDKYLSDSLLRQGVIPAKSFTVDWPSHLPESLYRHFIRGYLDGDGWVFTTRAHKRPSYTGGCGMISSVPFILGLKSYLVKIGFNFKYEFISKYSKPMANLKSNGKYEAVRFLDWIYSDTTTFLKRKYQKYQELKSTLRAANLPA